MSSQSIEAYELPARLKSYDADMDVMHPNRAVMADVLLDFLPPPTDAPLTVLDLGTGTGYLAKRFLEQFPEGRVVGVDGSQPMLDLAVARLGPLGGRLVPRLGDFRSLDVLLEGVDPLDAVFSAYALHHLEVSEKIQVVQQVLAALKPGGWFFNADLIVAENPVVEERIQHLRVQGIMARAALGDERFADPERTRSYLDKLEAEDGDQPVSLKEDLAILQAAGGLDVDVIWLKHREAVTCCRSEAGTTCE